MKRIAILPSAVMAVGVSACQSPSLTLSRISDEFRAGWASGGAAPDRRPAPGGGR
jgi:hypothetical protein